MRNKRKSKRNLSFKESTHFILRLKANLPALFEPRDVELRKQIYRVATKYHIRIYKLVLNHSHMHSVLLFPDRNNYVSFVREVTSFIVSHFTRTVGIPGLIFKKVFLNLPFTRAVPWGRAFQVLLNYMKKNEIESGCIEQSHIFGTPNYGRKYTIGNELQMSFEFR